GFHPWIHYYRERLRVALAIHCQPRLILSGQSKHTFRQGWIILAKNCGHAVMVSCGAWFCVTQVPEIPVHARNFSQSLFRLEPIVGKRSCGVPWRWLIIA